MNLLSYINPYEYFSAKKQEIIPLNEETTEIEKPTKIEKTTKINKIPVSIYISPTELSFIKNKLKKTTPNKKYVSKKEGVFGQLENKFKENKNNFACVLQSNKKSQTLAQELKNTFLINNNNATEVLKFFKTKKK